MDLRGSTRRKPAAAGRRQDERPRLLADEREPTRTLDGPVPELDPELAAEEPSHGRDVSDQAELGEAEQLLRREAALRARLRDAAVRDQLDDVAGRIVEVARLGLPVGEVEDDVAGLLVRQQLRALADPVENRVEPVAGGEQREMVEGLGVARRELEPGLADAEGDELV